MEIDFATFVKEFHAKMDDYYDEVAMQKLLNKVEELNLKEEITIDEALTIVSAMKLSDRFTAIVLAFIYDKPLAYLILQDATNMLLSTEVEKLRNSIINKTGDEFFKGYNEYDFYCLKKSIEYDEEDEVDNPIWNIERETLINYVLYKEGKRAKVLSK